MNEEQILSQLELIIENSTVEDWSTNEEGDEIPFEKISSSLAAEKIYQFLIDNDLIKTS